MTSDSASRHAKEAKILDLFDNYPNANPTREIVGQYLKALDAFSTEAVASCVAQYQEGLVARSQHAFVPSAEELSIETRKWQDAIDKRDAPPMTMHTGILSVDFGHGQIDMRGKTASEQDEIMRSRQMPQTRIAGVNIKINRIET